MSKESASNADRAPPVDQGSSTIEASPSQFQQASATFSQEAATTSYITVVAETEQVWKLHLNFFFLKKSYNDY